MNGTKHCERAWLRKRHVHAFTDRLFARIELHFGGIDINVVRDVVVIDEVHHRARRYVQLCRNEATVSLTHNRRIGGSDN